MIGPWIRGITAIVLAGAACLFGAGWAAPEEPFRVLGGVPTHITATLDPEPIDTAVAGSPMLRELSGIIGSLTPSGLVPLRRALGGRIDAEVLEGATRMGVLHLAGRDAAERVEVSRLTDGSGAVRSIDRPGTPAWRIDLDAIQATGIDWWRAHPDRFDGAGAERFAIIGDASPSPITLDRRTTRRLFKANYPDLTRDLTHEAMHVRLPARWDQRAPAGVLVWISPVEDGRVPRVFEPALDELGFIAVGVEEAGNTRALTDRLQLMLDAIETVRRRALIDESRVYVTGMSGGGRCSTILQCCLPDVFAGAVPIVGIDSYHNAPTGDGRTHWPARFARPTANALYLLRQRRIRGITGDQDFNEPEMVLRAAMMRDDGIQIELDVIPGMGHTMPTGEQFRSALRWVDEPRRTTLAANLAAALARLRAIDPEAPEPVVREALIEVTTLAPWSEPAWEAAERLGYERHAPP